MGPTRYPRRISSLGRGAILIVLALPPVHPAVAQHPDVPSTPSANHNSLSPTPLAQARKQFALGHYAEAVSLFQAAIAGRRPARLSDADSLSYATALAATGNIPAAEQQLTGALSRAPNSAPLNDALGTLTAQSGHADAALPYFQRAVATDPSLAQAQYHLGTALLALNRPGAAIAPLRRSDFERLAAVNPDDPQLREFMDLGTYAGQHCNLHADTPPTKSLPTGRPLIPRASR